MERGSKRVFAGAIDWPGWCRSGPDEEVALRALAAYVPRYAQVLRGRRLGFLTPGRAPAFTVVERLEGDATTDFGAPGRMPVADSRSVDARELTRERKILQACWTAFDEAAEAASGAPLRKGPRGGGRDLRAMVGHVFGAEAGYLRRLATTPPSGFDEADPAAAMEELRSAVLEAVSRAATEGLPAKGPRGGTLWTPRYFIRRDAWHVLDHAWEIEDRSAPEA